MHCTLCNHTNIAVGRALSTAKLIFARFDYFRQRYLKYCPSVADKAVKSTNIFFLLYSVQEKLFLSPGWHRWQGISTCHRSCRKSLWQSGNNEPVTKTSQKSLPAHLYFTVSIIKTANDFHREMYLWGWVDAECWSCHNDLGAEDMKVDLHTTPVWKYSTGFHFDLEYKEYIMISWSYLLKITHALISKLRIHGFTQI